MFKTDNKCNTKNVHVEGDVKETKTTSIINIGPLTTQKQTNMRVDAMLISRLRSLASNPSRESIQTLARWQLFHRRKHALSLCRALYREIESDDITPLRKVTYLDIVHEMLVLDSTFAINNGDVRRWEQWGDVRSILGEEVVGPALDAIRSALSSALSSGAMSSEEVDAIVGRLRTHAAVWTELDCFDSPTLLDEVDVVINSIGLDVERFRESQPVTSGSQRNNDDRENGKENSLNSPAKMTRKWENSKEMEDLKKKSDILNDSKPLSSPAKVADAQKEENKVRDTVVTTPTPSDIEDSEDLFGNGDDESVENIIKEYDHMDRTNRKLLSYNHGGKIQERKYIVLNLSPNYGCEKKKKNGSFNSQQDEKEHVFDNEGIPSGSIGIDDLQASCKSIVSMQINRDLRSDTTMQLSTILAMVPDSVMDACNAALDGVSSESNADSRLDIDQHSIDAVPDDVLDLDLSNALTNVKIYGDIVAKQRESRQKCIELLFKSRCQFGSEEAAKVFYSLEYKEEALRVRKRKIRDAMELEGLDFEGLGDEDGNREEDTLAEFAWYTKHQVDSTVKRPRL